jgi:hypothetical protein
VVIGAENILAMLKGMSISDSTGGFDRLNNTSSLFLRFARALDQYNLLEQSIINEHGFSQSQAQQEDNIFDKYMDILLLM